MIVTQNFFDLVRESLFDGKLRGSQIIGIKNIANSCIKYGVKDKRQIAYILATVFHETAKKMQPVKEFGSDTYLMSKAYYPYYGRDLCQTTWKVNYEKVKNFSGIDVVANPDLIGQMPLAADVAVVFMKNGWYTTKKLSMYFNEEIEDAVNARRIINGKDKAELIAVYYNKFLTALT